MAKRLTYSEAIEKVMLENNYFAPLKKIYKEIEKYRPLTGKTPHYTIQERVQRDARFTRIGLGVYALTEYLHKLPKQVIPKTEEEKELSEHTITQGMLVEIGNLEGYDTYAPQRNLLFANKPLRNLMTLERIPEFTYPHILDQVKHIDVLWFNDRGFPEKVFEVEYSTNFRSSLLKFTELIDFYSSFYVIARREKYNKFEKEITRSAFKDIRNRVRFHTDGEVKTLYETSISKNEISALFF